MSILRTIGAPRVRHCQKKVHAITFSPDGSLVAAGGYGNEIRVWRVDTNELVARHPVKEFVKALAFTRGGRLAWASYAGFHFVDDPHVVIPKKDMPNDPHSLAFNADETRIAIGGWYGTTKIFDLATREMVQQIDGGGHSIAWSKRGEIALSSMKGVLSIVATDGSKATSAIHDKVSMASSMIWSPGDEMLGVVEMSLGIVRFFDPATQTDVKDAKPLNKNFMTSALSPDLKLVAWADDAWIEIVDLESLASVPPRDDLELSDAMRVAVEPDGASVVVSDGKALTLFDGKDAIAWSVQTPGPGAVAFSGDGRRIAYVGQGRVNIVDSFDGVLVGEVSFRETKAKIGEVVFAPDGSFLVFAMDASTGGPMGDDGRLIAVVDLETKAVRTWEHHFEMITDSIGQSSDTEVTWQRDSIIEGIAISHDGSMLASTSIDRTKVWRREDWKMLAEIPSGGWSVAFRENGVVIAREKTIEVWDSGKMIAATEIVGGTKAERARCSRDGSTVVVRQGAKLQAFRNGVQIASFEDHVGRVVEIALSTTGAHFASTGEDRTIRRRTL